MTQIFYYSAPWCDPCKTFGPIVSKVVGECGVELVKINADEIGLGGEVTKKAFTHHVNVVPTLVKEVDGQFVAMLEGAKNEETVRVFVATEGT